MSIPIINLNVGASKSGISNYLEKFLQNKLRNNPVFSLPIIKLAINQHQFQWGRQIGHANMTAPSTTLQTFPLWKPISLVKFLRRRPWNANLKLSPFFCYCYYARVYICIICSDPEYSAGLSWTLWGTVGPPRWENCVAGWKPKPSRPTPSLPTPRTSEPSRSTAPRDIPVSTSFIKNTHKLHFRTMFVSEARHACK